MFSFKCFYGKREKSSTTTDLFSLSKETLAGVTKSEFYLCINQKMHQFSQVKTFFKSLADFSEKQ